MHIVKQGWGNMKMRVGVLFGGNSVEHEISILTALQVMEHLKPEEYDVIPIYLSKNSQFYSDQKLKERKTFQNLEAIEKNLKTCVLCRKNHKNYIHFLSKAWKKDIEFDYLIPVMHGTNGEDGSIQGYLNILDIPYCGSVLSGAIAQDKGIMKHLLKIYQLPIIPYAILHDAYTEEELETVIQEIDFPMILKPSNLGSSIGIMVVENETELAKALESIFLYDKSIVVEKMLRHIREYNCSVLGNRKEIETSAIEEVKKQDVILSYRDKYECDSSKIVRTNAQSYVFQIDQEDETVIHDLAKKSFQALQGEGIVRVDFIKDLDSNQIYINEVNTIPGSFAYYLWEQKGVSFSDLLKKYEHLLLEKMKQKQEMIHSYETNILKKFMEGSKFHK